MNKVSVLIPLYNSERTIAETVQSIIDQRWNDFEIIVVDDLSDDNSFETVKALQTNFHQIKLFQNPVKGGNQARNHAFSQCIGDFIQWLDADDIILPGKFKDQVEALNKNPDADVAYSDWRLDSYKDNILVSSADRFSKQYDDYLFQLLVNNWQPCHGYMMRRRLAELLHNSYGGWDTSIKIGQDREYFTKAAIFGRTFIYVPGIFAKYQRSMDKSVSNLDFKKRILLDLETDEKILNYIRFSKRFNKRQIDNYTSVYNANLIKSFFYNHKVRISKPFSLFNIKSSTIHKNIIIIMPLLYIISHLLYFIKFLKKSGK